VQLVGFNKYYKYLYSIQGLIPLYTLIFAYFVKTRPGCHGVRRLQNTTIISFLNFLFPVNILVFFFFKIHFNIVLLSKPKSLSVKYSQADSRSRFWGGCLPENISWNSVATRASRFSLCIGYSVSSSMWNSVHIVFLRELYTAITSEKATQWWTNLYNEKVWNLKTHSDNKEFSGLNIESRGPVKC